MLYNMDMIDITRLRTFRAVVAEGSVNRAASNLGYTPSAVSQQIHALQKETGLQLIERNGRGIIATPIGLRFAQEAEPLLQQASRLDALASDLRVGRTGSLTISHISSVGGAWMPSVVSALVAEFPDLRLDLRLLELAQRSAETSDVVIDLAPAGTQELSPRAVRVPEPEGGVLSETLVTEPYVVVMPPGHQFAGRPEVVLAQLRDEMWIDNTTLGGLCRQILLDACASCGFVPDFYVQANDDATAVAFVAAGIGITVMPRLSYDATGVDLHSIAVATIVDPTPARTITVSTKESVVNNLAVHRLLELLRIQAADAIALTAPVEPGRPDRSRMVSPK